MGKLEELEEVGRSLRKHPLRTGCGLLVLLLSAVAVMWGTGFVQEIGRQKAARLENSTTAQPADTAPKAPPKLGFQYYLFEGSTSMDHVWRGYGFSDEEGFASTPHWWKNRIRTDLDTIIHLSLRKERRPVELGYDTMDLLARRPDGKLSFQREVQDYSYAEHKERPPFADHDKIRRQFFGALGAFRRSGYIQFTFDDLLRRVEEQPFWTLTTTSTKPTAGGVLPWDSFAFFGLPSEEEALRYTDDPISRAVLEARPELEDVVFVRASASYHGGYFGIVMVRELKLLALDVFNMGTEPVVLERLVTRELTADNPFQVLTEQEYQSRLASTTPGRRHRPPIAALMPGAHLFIPIRIELGFATSVSEQLDYSSDACIYREDLPTADWWRRLPEVITLDKLESVNESYEPQTSHVELSRAVLEEKPDLRGEVQSTYYLGNVLEVDGVVVKSSAGDQEIAVRRFDPSNIIIRGGYAKGSCPILYVREGSDWRRRGPVLVDAVTKSREQAETIRVPGKASSFEIAEEEAELSLLDEAYLAVTTASGEVMRFSPDGRPELGRADGRRLKLEQGDRVTLRFDVPSEIAETRRELVIRGFYVPDSLIRSRRGRNRPRDRGLDSRGG